MSVHTAPSSTTALDAQDKARLEDVGFMTCMTLTLLGNYAQTGHFGGPLAYTPYNVAAHLAGPELGGLRYDYRRPKHPYGDKFMLAGGPLRADLLRPVDDHGRGAGAPVQGDRTTGSTTSRRRTASWRSTRSASAAAPAR